MQNLTVKKGRPSFQPNENDRQQVEKKAGVGIRHEDIAAVLGMTAKTLRKHFRRELDRGAIEANTQVLETLFEMAKSGKNTAATIFWVKTRCGWREETPPREAVEEKAPSLRVLVG
jgi:hypothetical protein